MRWFGQLECKSVFDWVSSCRRLVSEGLKITKYAFYFYQIQ